MKNVELAEVLLRSRQTLWILRAASCGSGTCPAPDSATALRMMHAAANGLLELASEIRERDRGSVTPVPRYPIVSDRASVERLAAKCVLEIEELQRNIAFMVRDMDQAVDRDDAARLGAASAAVERAVSAFRIATEAALLGLPPASS